MGNWTANNISSQKNKTVLVTGANSGLGFETSRVMANKGAKVIMAVRNVEKGKEAQNRILKAKPEADVQLMAVDLADLDSVRNFSEEFKSKFQQLDILVNNAGVMMPNKREETKQGFEVQFGTNHLAHFALTGHLLPLIKNTPASRVVNISSIYHKVGADIHFDDLNWKKSYDKNKAYAQSKLANMLFTYELDRLFKANQVNAISVAAHPGYTSTNLQRHMGFVGVIANALVAQSIEMGTLPSLMAATLEGLKGGEYFGPTGMAELRGYPKQVSSSAKSHDLALAKKLWEVSVEMTGVKYLF